MHRGLNLSTHDLIRWFLYGMIFLVPLAAMGGDAIVPLTVMRIFTLLIVAIWGLQIFAQGTLNYRQSPLNPWLALYAVTLILITLASSHSWSDFFGDQGTFRGLVTILNLLFIAGVVANFFQRKEEIHGALKLGGIAILISTVATIQTTAQSTIGAVVHRTNPELVLHGILILIWATLFWKTVRSHSIKFSVKILTALLFALGLAYEISEMFTGNNIVRETLFFILTGLVVSYYHIIVDSTPQSRQFKRIPIARFSKLVFTLIVLMAWLLSAWFTMRQVSADYALKQGDIARRDNNVQAMLRYYKKATQQIPWMPALWERYGDGAQEAVMKDSSPEVAQQQLETAIYAYELAEFRSGGRAELSQKIGEVYLGYARILEERGRYAKAEEAHVEGIKWYREASVQGEEDLRFAYEYGELLIGEKRYEEAEEVFKVILAADESYEDTYYELALIATELKRYDDARANIQQALQKNAADERVKALLQRINQETR